MIFADKLRKENICEYLLYMFQVEDIIRLYACDAERMEREYLCRFPSDWEGKERESKWYADLCEMMRSEGKRERGHLQIVLNSVQDLTDLHLQLLKSDRFGRYRELYYKVLPYIVELRAKKANTEAGELQVCLEAVYGYTLLRMQKTEVSEGTRKATQEITALLAELAAFYKKNEQGTLEI